MRPYSDYEEHFAKGGLYGGPFKLLAISCLVGCVVATIAWGKGLLGVFVFIAICVLAVYLIVFGRRRRELVDRNYLFDWFREFGFTERQDQPVPPDAPFVEGAVEVLPATLLVGQVAELGVEVFDYETRTRRKQSLFGLGDGGPTISAEFGKRRESDLVRRLRVVRLTGPAPVAPLRVDRRFNAGAERLRRLALGNDDGFSQHLGPVAAIASGIPAVEAQLSVSSVDPASLALPPECFSWLHQHVESLPATLAFYDGYWWYQETEFIEVKRLDDLRQRIQAIAGAIAWLTVSAPQQT